MDSLLDKQTHASSRFRYRATEALAEAINTLRMSDAYNALEDLDALLSEIADRQGAIEASLIAAGIPLMDRKD